MTPPPPATAAPRAGAGGRLGNRSGSSIPRRVSGPARPRAARASAGGFALPRPIGLRIPRPSRRSLAGAGTQVAGLLRGRGLIVVLAGLLLGLVFLQVSLLKLNTQISQNVERAQALERDNAGKRSVISRLDAGRRIQDVAGQLGMVMPGPGAVCYLSAGRGSACSGGDPAAAASAVDPAAETAPVMPGGTSAVAADPAQTAPATAPAAATTAPAAQPTPVAQPQTTAPAQTTAPVTQAQPQQTPAPAATPVPQQTAAPADPTGATGGIAAGAGG